MSPDPYKFLDPYDLEDAHLFFGRDREIRVLLSDVLVSRLVVLFAPTGTGKTSLINAGVRPRLEAQGFATFFIRVHEDPVASARAELARNVGPAGVAAPGEGFVPYLRSVKGALGRPIVLFFDQFEEFFIYVLGPHPERGEQFINDVAALYHDRDSGIRLVFSMREEFFVEMDAFRDRIPTIFHNETNLRLRRFDLGQARDAIVLPSRACGTVVEPALVDRLLIDLAEAGRESGARRTTGDIEPAQLQIVCDSLWGARKDGHLTLEHYRALGRGAGRGGNIARQVLFDRLEAGFHQIREQAQLELLGWLLPELRTQEGTKYVRDVEGLEKALASAENLLPELDLLRRDPRQQERVLRELLDILTRARFLRRGRRDSHEVVELSHDYLVDQLDLLRERVQLIWPRRRLDQAVARYAAQEGHATFDELQDLVRAAEQLPLGRDEAELLFRSALARGHHPEVWFRLASDRGVAVWRIIDGIFADGELAGEAARVGLTQRSNVVELCSRVLSTSDARLLAGDNVERSLSLLERALRREDVGVEAQQVLAKLGTESSGHVAESAAERLLRYLDRAVSAGRVDQSTVRALGFLEHLNSVSILERALEREELAMGAQRSLALLAGAQNRRVRVRAGDVLYNFVGAALERRAPLAPSTIRAISAMETLRSVQLLRSILAHPSPGVSADDVLTELRHLAKEAGAAVAEGARQALIQGVPTVVERERQLQARAPADLDQPAEPPLESPISEGLLTMVAQMVSLGHCVLCLGAGVSAGPLHGTRTELQGQRWLSPTGELTERLALQSDFGRRSGGESPHSLSRVAEHFEWTYGRQSLVRELRSALQTDLGPSPMLRTIARLPFAVILTTNLDGYTEQALREAGKDPRVIIYDPDVRVQTPDIGEPSVDLPILLKLHGDLSVPTSLVLTDEDYIHFILRLSDRDPVNPIPSGVRFFLKRWPLLLIGLDLGEFRTRTLFRSLRWKVDVAHLPQWCVLDPDPDPLLLRAQSRDWKFITEDPGQFISALFKEVTRHETSPLLLDEEQDPVLRWREIEQKYPVGTRVRGQVVSLHNYGAFVELEKGVEGLVHVSQMSWTRNVRHPSKIVALGDEIEVMILKVDPEGEKISLGMKQTVENPWHTLPIRYPVGTRLRGRVRNLTSFGAFVEIEPGIDGLVHISDMSWTKRVQHPSEVVKKGDDMEVVILGIDAENKRIVLGLKQTQDNPWGDIAQQYHVGQKITGPISRLQDRGVAVNLGNDIEGFIPVSQLGVAGLRYPAEVFVMGDVLEMRITRVDAANHRIVCEVVRVPKFVGGEPQFIQLATPPASAAEASDDAGDETVAEAPAATEAQAPAAEADEAPASAEEAPAADAAPAEEAPAAEEEQA